MDFDGLLLLMDKDLERFIEWNEKSKSLSLEELREDINEWMTYYHEMYEKYKDLSSDDKLRDVTLFGAKMSYFYFLAKYTLNALVIYTAKLQTEYNSLKKSKRTKAGKKSTKTKRSLPSKYI